MRRFSGNDLNVAEQDSLIASKASLEYTPKELRSRLFVHLMMDKLRFENMEQYERFPLFIPAYALIKVLKEKLPAPLKRVPALAIPLLREFIHFEFLLQEDLVFSQPHESFAERVAHKLLHQPIGSHLLIPAITSNHATCLLITKTAQDKIQMTHYNTGEGVQKWHYRWKQTDRYQTYDTIRNVPITPLLNPKSWAFIRKDRGLSTDALYHFIRTHLGASGTRLPPSLKEEDYEAIQSSDTCTMQMLMAFLRHQVMRMGQGSPCEKEALYKLFKCRLFNNFINIYPIEETDVLIQDNLHTVLLKLRAEEKLLEISVDVDRFTEALRLIQNELIRYGSQSKAKSLEQLPSSSMLARYAILRKASTLLCKVWIALPQSPQPRPEPTFQLAYAKMEHHAAIMKNRRIRLQQYASQNRIFDLSQELALILITAQYREFGLEQVVFHLGSDKPFEKNNSPSGTKILLNLLHEMNGENDPIVTELIRHLNEAGKYELAIWIETYWDRLSRA